MKKLLITALFLTLSLNSFADEINDEALEKEARQLFGKMDDENTKINQKFSDYNIFTPFNSPFAQQNFVPDISLILDFSYAYRDKDNSQYSQLQTPISPHLNGLSNSRNGFNLNYAEFAIASTVDPYFDLFTNFHLGETFFEIEEAFVNTRGLPGGIQLKAGKFFSSIGRLNSQHAHFWNFEDMPIIYKSFFGGEHTLLEPGVHINWIAPTDTYLMFGAELLQGRNTTSFGTTSFDTKQASLPEINSANLFTSFIKSSIDFDNMIFLGGLSYAQGGNRNTVEAVDDGHNHEGHNHGEINNSANFAGGTRIYGGDITAKYFFDPYRYISLQSEYLHRSISGSEYTDSSRTPFSSEQGGFYTQLVTKFDLLWKAGLRIDLLTMNNINKDNKLQSSLANNPRLSAMIEFNPTEFSRLRLQYNHDRSMYNGNSNEIVNEVFLSLNMAIGAHGAHDL